MFLKDCPGNCINATYGICNDVTGKCDCTPEYIGLRCDIEAKKCPSDCTSKDNGICDKFTGKCNCNAGFRGLACEIKKGKEDFEHWYT